VQNLGIRYLLPAYPFLILMASQTAEWLWMQRGPGGRAVGIAAVAALLIGHASTATVHARDVISYFNDLVPSAQKPFLLGDSNLDIGQDVKRLALAARARGWREVKLAQFGGTVDPSKYGLEWAPWTRNDLKGPQPGFVYAVNRSLFQLGSSFYPELRAISEGWASTRPPSGQVGDTWIYFEIPGETPSDPSDVFQSVRTF
jgi:hypothetical protein